MTHVANSVDEWEAARALVVRLDSYRLLETLGLLTDGDHKCLARCTEEYERARRLPLSN